ncbi:MAG: hypothetical protein K6F75_10380 [Butyrivibrio sp.]|nr:hypothetical protein [Butyrivibrio sp.]
MKRKYLVAACVAAMILSGCGNTETSDDSVLEKEPVTTQIQSEVAGIAAAGNLSDELEMVTELYDQYDDMRMSAETQTEMNEKAQWGTMVWVTEVESLMERIENCGNSSAIEQIRPAFEEWSANVDAMAEKMSYSYEGGSIQGMIILQNKGILYRNEAFALASTLADLNGDVTFSFPTRDPYGYYGDFVGGDYLILTEGMESGSYTVLISKKDAGEITGYGFQADGEAFGSSDGELTFASDDDSVSGALSYSAMGANFSVTESTNDAFPAGSSYEFSFHN